MNLRYRLSEKFLLALACLLIAVLTGCAPKPTPTPTPTLTLTPTRIPTKTMTLTPTMTSTQTMTPTLTHTPTVTMTKGVCPIEGQEFRLTGYLSLLVGSYGLNSKAYVIAFYFEDANKERTMARIYGGNRPNSMYFVDGKPKIKDKYGGILDWTVKDGVTTYRTEKVIITGKYYTDYDNLPNRIKVNCYLDVDTIEDR